RTENSSNMPAPKSATGAKYVDGKRLFEPEAVEMYARINASSSAANRVNHPALRSKKRNTRVDIYSLLNFFLRLQSELQVRANFPIGSVAVVISRVTVFSGLVGVGSDGPAEGLSFAGSSGVT